MEELILDPAFRTYAACAALLALKSFGSAVYTGVQRQQSQGYRNAEDARVFGAADAVASTTENPAVERGLSMQRNDAENLPAFFAIGLVYVLAGATPSGAAWYLWTFTIARFAHTGCYIAGLQPYRAISYFVGELAVVGMAVSVLAKVY